MYEAAAGGLDLLSPVFGGATRVKLPSARGLEALAAQQPEIVLVHDAARPFVSPAMIERAIARGEEHRCRALASRKPIR